MSLLFVGLPGSEMPGLPATAAAGEVLLAATEALEAQEASGARDGVLVVAPAQTARSSEIARAVAGHPGLARVQPQGPTTQLALLAAVLLRHDDLSPADALAVAREVPRHVVTHAVLTSVSGLSSPRPSLWQHVAGWAPWTRFWVDAAAGTISSTERPASVPSFLTATLDPGTAPKLVVDELLPAGPEPLPTLDTPVGDRWGTSRFVERSYLTTPTRDIVDAALAVQARSCANCDRPARTARCDFCGVVRSDRKASA